MRAAGWARRSSPTLVIARSTRPRILTAFGPASASRIRSPARRCSAPAGVWSTNTPRTELPAALSALTCHQYESQPDQWIREHPTARLYFAASLAGDRFQCLPSAGDHHGCAGYGRQELLPAPAPESMERGHPAGDHPQSGGGSIVCRQSRRLVARAVRLPQSDFAGAVRGVRALSISRNRTRRL